MNIYTSLTIREAYKKAVNANFIESLSIEKIELKMLLFLISKTKQSNTLI